jgi:hypothetical protein
MHKMRDAKPPFISTGDPGSFAQYTMNERLPAILDSVIVDNEVSGPERKALLSLKEELQGGRIGKLQLEGNMFEPEEVSVWERCLRQYWGKSWHAIPWYVAEAFFYFKVLLEFGYFTKKSSYYKKDPFEIVKWRELLSHGGGLGLAKRLDAKRTLKELVYFSLWGNRIDLSRFDIASIEGERIEENVSDKLVVDHSNRLAEKLLRAGRVDVVTDNSGTELVCDLMLARRFLQLSNGKRVHFHMKKYPIYVSDATVRDAKCTIGELCRQSEPQLKRLGEELLRFVSNERLFFHHHFFWNSPLHFPDFTDDLRASLAKSDIVILKGDVNYRRLLSDRKWPHTTNMEEVTGYFPSAFAVLRTLKSEIVVDLDEETVSTLHRADSRWMVNGERGVIRLVAR